MRTRSALIGLSLGIMALGCEGPQPDAEAPAPSVTPALDTTTIGREATADQLHPLPPGATLMVNPNRRLAGSSVRDGRVSATNISDWSGTVHMKLWTCGSHTPVAHPVIRCSVDPGWVLVGGGAWAGGSPSAGGLLTANYPFDPQALTTWEGRSKDHIVSDPHTLVVFAIGLSLSGVSSSTLRSNIVVSQATGGPANHPSASLPAFPSDFVDLGGGAITHYNGAGSLLFTNFPWAAQSKDHINADPATITLYRLGIRKLVPGFVGELEQLYKLVNAGSSGGLVQVSTTLDASYVPVGVGAFSFFNGPGRMLNRVGPTNAGTVTSFTASAKDHVQADSGGIYILLSQLRRKP